jgi:hypothetical protein
MERHRRASGLLRHCARHQSHPRALDSVMMARSSGKRRSRRKSNGRAGDGGFSKTGTVPAEAARSEEKPERSESEVALQP